MAQEKVTLDDLKSAVAKEANTSVDAQSPAVEDATPVEPKIDEHGRCLLYTSPSPRDRG